MPTYQQERKLDLPLDFQLYVYQCLVSLLLLFISQGKQVLIHEKRRKLFRFQATVQPRFLSIWQSKKLSSILIELNDIYNKELVTIFYIFSIQSSTPTNTNNSCFDLTSVAKFLFYVFSYFSSMNYVFRNAHILNQTLGCVCAHLYIHM